MYNFLRAGIIEILEENNCQYQSNFPNDLCCFNNAKIEMDREKIVEMAAKDKYQDIKDYLLGVIKKAKQN